MHKICSSTSYHSRYSHQIFLMRFLLHSRCSAHDLHHRFSRCFQHLHWMNLERAEFLLSICATYAKCDTHLQVVHRCFFVLSWCYAYAQTRLWWSDVNFLWSRLTYASHRARSFFNPTSDLECARHMSILKFNPTPRIFSDPGSTFSTPRPAVTRLIENPIQSRHTRTLTYCFTKVQ